MDKCQCSGSVQKEVKRKDIDFRIASETIKFNMEVPTCSSCGKILSTKDVRDKVEQEALKLYKKKYGLLSGEEIKHIRVNILNMSHNQFAKYLSVCPTSIFLWERRNRPQWKSVDQLIRIKSSPEYIEKHLVKRVHI